MRCVPGVACGVRTSAAARDLPPDKESAARGELRDGIPSYCSGRRVRWPGGGPGAGKTFATNFFPVRVHRPCGRIVKRVL